MMKPLSVYIHIPFCVKKCLYCDFLSFFGDEDTRAAYVQALCQEIREEAKNYKSYQVVTVFLGGGTPSLLSACQIAGILTCVRENFCLAGNVEISTEANPGTLSREKLEVFAWSGVNRISFGLQSGDDEELKYLGRIHTWEEFLKGWEWAEETGFGNRNVDLMSALPGQTMESYVNSLEKVLALKPEHISAYSLMIEEGTPFYERYGGNPTPAGYPALPDEKEERQMYEKTGEILEKQGYCRYEISNYALEGKECVHNVGYWTRRDYVGFGLGAASMVENVRWNNRKDLQGYLHAKSGERKVNRQRLSVKEQMEEFMFLGLRLTEGVSEERFFSCFGVTLEEIYGQVTDRHRKTGLLKRERGRIWLTQKGIDVSNWVLADFLL